MTEAEFLSQYMLPDEERKRLLLGNVLLGIGGGLMSGKRGNEIGALGSGAVVGAQMGQQAISDAQRGQLDKMKLRQTWQEGEDKKRAQEASQQVSADISRLFAPQNPTENMPSRAPTVDNAANIPAKRQKWEIYLEAAEKAALGRDMVAAKHWAELAEKHKPKFSTTPHVGLKDGKAGNYVLDDMGNEKPLGFAPPPKFMTIDDGKTKQIRNEYLMPETGVNVAMQTTPGQDQSAALQRAQMAQSERHFQANQGGGGKPQLVNGQWVYPPDAQNPTGRVVTPEGFNAKETAVPQAFKDKNTALKNLGNSIDEYNKSLEKFSTSTYMNPTEATRLLGRYTSLKMDLKNLYELGALAGPDIAILEEGLTDPASIKGFVMPQAHFTTQTQVLKDRLTSARKNLANSYGQPYEQDTPASGKTIVRTGTNKKTGKRVILYSDGTQVEQ